MKTKLKNIYTCLLLTIGLTAQAQVQFQEVTPSPFNGVTNSSIAFADIDGDNDQDILMTGSDNLGGGAITNLYRNDGNGIFTLVAGTSFTGVYNSSIAFADIDGDNDQDVLITGYDNGNQNITELYTNDGSGNFTIASGTPLAGVNSGSVAFADVDGDNDKDVLITGANSSKLYSNDGNGNFTLVNGTPFDGVSYSSIAFADIDGDNDQDVLITGDNSSQYIAKLYTNDGSGNFTLVSGTPFTGVNSGAVAFADIDGDNDLDVLITGNKGIVAPITFLYINDGSGNFTLVNGTPFSSVMISSVVFADVDKDNDQDLLITGYSGGPSGDLSELYSNDGNGNFTLVSGTPFIGVNSGSVAFADVDGDNDADLVLTGSGSSKLYRNMYCVPTSSTLSVTSICSYTSPSGNATYTTSGSYIDTIPNVGGCDSVITINLTINNITDQTIAASDTILCDSGATPVLLGNSENWVNYYLRNNADSSIVDGPIAGTGSGISFNTGTITSTTTYNVYAESSNLIPSTAINLPTTDDYIQFSTPYTAYSNVITVEAWVNSAGNEFPWAGQSTSATDNMSTNVWLWHNGTWFVNNNGGWASLNFPAIPNGWTHVATVADVNGMYIYYDGILVASNTSGITSNIIANPNSVINLGQDPRFPPGTSGRNSDVTFEEFRVWNTARTVSEINSSMNNCLAGNEVGLVQYTTFNDGTGTILNSTTGSNGVVVNSSNNWVSGKGNCSGSCNLQMSQTVTVTVNNSSTSTISSTACGSYTTPSGNATYTTSGSYMDTIPNVGGCDSVITINLTINTVDNTTVANNDTITANQTGATYQWIDCNNGNAVITGATNQQYVATSNGDYAVVVTMNGCTDTSACVNVTSVGVHELNQANISIYPNPTSGLFTISLANAKGAISYTITTLEGRIVEQANNVSQNNIQVNLTNESKGVYFLIIQENNTNRTYKIIRQ
ncbi:MAG: VCBS repeat-containing protein [Flavobacteriales bacterium]|nr:VCBS repeat-containing protein [Flavobacteriales bacterium]MCB9363715.1 VCBS repeat-containing protein [Flavobacteriales bacterium]